MSFINKISLGSAIDFAAEELKKYLRMMMPDGENFNILYNPRAVEGYRLGLMSDFGLDTSDAEDTELDDIIYIDTKGKSGIIAGSNPRSVLIAVYEYLRQNGCEWVMPGIDGEIIPLCEVCDVKYRFKPSMRYRGWVFEGCSFQRSELEAVDYMLKLGLNAFMIQFKFPRRCYERYFEHQHNPVRMHELVGDTTLIQWKRMIEAELEKRGIQFHDMGHGFTYEPLGIPGEAGWDTEYDEKMDDKTRSMIAMINGKREIFNIPINTNFCMSNSVARGMVVDYVVNYSRRHSNVDYLHVWLADANNNHCECLECAKKLPSDWYVMMLNEIDDALTKENIKTRIVFIAYMDTAWAPIVEKINNPDRFLLMIAPITRNYTETLPSGLPTELAPFTRNTLKMPRELGEFLAHLKKWDKSFTGKKISFEYHFWRAMYTDVSSIKISEVVSEDVREYLRQGVNGILQCGTQRCYTPTGLCFYTFARTAFDSTLSAKDLKDRYFTLLFGDYKREVEEYLLKLEAAFDNKYLAKLKSSNPNVSVYYNPDRAKALEAVESITAEGKKMIMSHLCSELRPRSVAMHILLVFNEIMRYFARAMSKKALGRDEEAKAIYEEMKVEIGKLEADIDYYYDHGQFMDALRIIFDNTVSNLAQNDYM